MPSPGLEPGSPSIALVLLLCVLIFELLSKPITLQLQASIRTQIKFYILYFYTSLLM